MNRFLVYSVIAILLGSVTMVVPLALLGPDNLVPAASNDNILGAGEGTTERNDVVPSFDVTTQQSNGNEMYDNSSEISVRTSLGETDVASGLSSMGLIIVPGFLVALGIFVYIKKRIT
ncbi:MAG: hypothetical protein JW815_02080 [Candidatus Bathyarchaeota archaeon]|nr:hypothetical protein [Candidatus Bathyarchaeum sp.]